MTADATIDAFVDAGLDCYEADALPNGLDELAIRADLIGAGPILDSWAKRRVKRQRARHLWLARRR